MTTHFVRVHVPFSIPKLRGLAMIARAIFLIAGLAVLVAMAYVTPNTHCPRLTSAGTYDAGGCD
jgi:hypothetical protein